MLFTPWCYLCAPTRVWTSVPRWRQRPSKLGKSVCQQTNAPTITNNFKPANGKDANQQIVLPRMFSLFSLSTETRQSNAIINSASRLKRYANIDKRDTACIYTRKILLRRDIWYDERDHFIKFLILIGFEQETETWKIIISLIIIYLIIWYWKLMTTF